MSISIDGLAPVYTPTPQPREPQPDAASKADRQAALEEAIAAARRALEAARKAQEAAEKAEKALDAQKDSSKQASLKSDHDARQEQARQKADDLKVAIKAAYAAGGPQDQEKVNARLKAIDGKDGEWQRAVDKARDERPDPAIIPSGHKAVDAAARRVSNAYASGGEAAAASQLRTELEQAKTPEDRRAILRSSMPVVDKVTQDLGANGRRTEADWEQKAGSNDKHATSQGPIDTRSELDHAVADLEASVELAGDQEAAFHIAHDILQMMPGGDRANSANNLLGMLGVDLGQSSPGRTSMLETAMAAALVQPEAGGSKRSMLSMPLEQRSQAARLLAPDRPTTITVRDWTDDKGVEHDGTLWHEVEQNPDLLLTKQQRAEIDKMTRGWSAAEVSDEKTRRAIENLRQQNPGKDVDRAKAGSTFVYQAEDPRRNLPEALAKEVQAAVDKSKAAHRDDLAYGADLDKLTRSDAFRELGTDQQAEAIGQFDRTVTQALEASRSGKGDKGLAEGQKGQLRELVASPSFQDVNGRVQDRLLGLFGELAKNDSCDTSALKRLVDHPGFRTLDSEAGELQVLESYQHDSVYREAVDKLAGRSDLPATDARSSLQALTQVQSSRQLYEKSNDDDKRKILDSVLEATTDARFRGFAQNQKDAAIDQLVKYGDRMYALEGRRGLDRALNAAAEVKPSARQPADSDKAPAKPPLTPAGPPTVVSVKADLARLEAGAHDVATSQETINDPLRKIAGQDPITYAYLQAQADRRGDKYYLKLLDQALPQHRREVTTRQVKDLASRDQPEEAMKLLSTQLDATRTPAERRQLWEAAGAPVFTRAYFEKQIDQALRSQGPRLEDLGRQFGQVGENAPPEVANLTLDAIKAHTDKGSDDPLWTVLMNDVSANAGMYEGLSLLVQRADALGGHRTEEMARFYVDGFDKVSRERGLSPGTALMLTGGPEGGLRLKISESISGHGAAGLSVALYNAARKHPAGPDLGGRDWTDTIETKTRNGIRDGIKDFHNELQGDVTDWQEQNKNALRLMQDFGGTDPEGVARALARDRKNHPDTYFHLDDDGKAEGVDVAYAKVEQRGIQADGLMRDLLGLEIDFGKPSVPAEKLLGDEIQSLDKDPLVVSTLKNNLALDEHRADQLNFGQFDPENSPFSPLVAVTAQRDHLGKLVRDNGIPPALATRLEQRTDRWENDLNAALGASDKVDGAKLQGLTDDYHRDLKALLKDKVADGGEGALVQRPTQVVEEILSDWQSIGTTTSTLRLTMNWFRDSGDTLLRAYTQVAFRRAVNGQARFEESSLVRNAARLGLSDEKTIRQMEKFMHEMRADIDAKLKASGKSRLSAAEYDEVMEKFKGQAATYGPVKPFDPHAAPELMKTSERVTRGLGMLCYFGSAVNNGINAAENEPGLSSSDAFAALFGTGAVVEAYRTVKGKQMQGGELQTLLNNGKRTPEHAEELAKFLKSNAVGGLIALADVAWAYEDFTGQSIGGHKNGDGDPIAGWLTAGVVAGDFLELGAGYWRARLAATAAAEGAAVAGSTAAPILGWVAAGIQAVFIGARFAYGVTKEKNKFEFENNEDYAQMVKSLGFTEDQARELMNQSGGNSDVKLDWKSFGDSTPFMLAYGKLESFFQEGGMGPMHVLDPLFDANEVPLQQRLQYLQSLSPDEIKQLVGRTHQTLDDEMDDAGKISEGSLESLEDWMRENKLWKAEYLGAA